MVASDLNLLLVRSHQAEIIIVKRLIHGKATPENDEVTMTKSPYDEVTGNHAALTLIAKGSHVVPCVLAVFSRTAFRLIDRSTCV